MAGGSGGAAGGGGASGGTSGASSANSSSTSNASSVGSAIPANGNPGNPTGLTGATGAIGNAGASGGVAGGLAGGLGNSVPSLSAGGANALGSMGNNLKNNAINAIGDKIADKIPNSIGGPSQNTSPKAPNGKPDSDGADGSDDSDDGNTSSRQPVPEKKEPGKKSYEELDKKDKEKVDNGQEVNQDSSTKKLLRTAGRGVAAYATGGQSLGADKQVANFKPVDKTIGVVSDTLDKVPGVKEVSEEVDKAGVTDGLEGAMDVVGAIKNKDLGEAAEGAKKTAEGVGKLAKYVVKKIIIAMLIVMLPFLIVIVITVGVLSPIIGGFLDLTDNGASTEESINATQSDPYNVGTGGNGGTGGTGGYGNPVVTGNINYGDYEISSVGDGILNMPLSTFLANHGSSVEELQNTIKENVRAQGCGTKAAVAAAAVTLIAELGNKYNIKLPYYYGGGHSGSNDFVDGKWGGSCAARQAYGNTYDVCGLDCSGFVGWAMRMGGVNGETTVAHRYQNLGRRVNLNPNAAVVSPGDFLESDTHVVVVIGVDEARKVYKIAEASGKQNGIRFSEIKFNNTKYWGVDMGAYYEKHKNPNC